MLAWVKKDFTKKYYTPQVLILKSKHKLLTEFYLFTFYLSKSCFDLGSKMARHLKLFKSMYCTITEHSASVYYSRKNRKAVIPTNINLEKFGWTRNRIKLKTLHQISLVKVFIRGGIEHITFEAKTKDSKKSEAKDRLFEDRPCLGQG